MEEGQGHSYLSTGTASISSWLEFDASEWWVEGLLTDSERLEWICWPLHLKFQCLPYWVRQWSLVLIRWHIEQDAHHIVLWRLLPMLFLLFCNTRCGLCRSGFWTLSMFCVMLVADSNYLFTLLIGHPCWVWCRPFLLSVAASLMHRLVWHNPLDLRMWWKLYP